jgi:hypothetical protein
MGGLADNCDKDGEGGAGARVAGGTLLYSLVSFKAGKSCNFEPAGLLVETGQASLIAPPEPTLGWTGSTAAGTQTRFQLQGPAGAPAVLAFGSAPVQLPFPASLLGLLTSADLALLVGQVDLGTGDATFLVQVSSLLQSGARIPTQAAILYPDGQWRLTNSVTVLVR